MTVEVSRQHSRKELPDGWRWVRLGEVCDVVNGFGFAEHLQGRQHLLYPFIKVSDMNADGAETVITKAANTVDKPLLSSLHARTYPVGTVIFPKVGGALLTNKKRVLGVEATFDNNIMGLVPKGLDSTWLFYWIRTIDLRELANTQALPSIRQSEVASLAIPLPPLPEQKRIAAILNEQMVAVERARAAAEAQLELSASFVESCLRRSLSDQNVRRIPLNQCLDEVSSGVGSTWKIYPVMGATRDGIAPAKEAVGKNPERYKLVEPGTLFYNPMRILIGSIAMIDEGEETGITSPDYVVFKTANGMLHPRWFYYWLRSSYGEAFIKSLARGAVRERMLFRRLVGAEIDLPSWEVQLDVADKLKSVAYVRRSVAGQLDTINKLPAALLRQAFSGEL